MLKRFCLLVAGLMGLAVPGGAVVPSVPFYILQPPAGQIDNLFEAIATPTGFLVTFARSTGSVPPFTLYTQRFSKAGAKQGKAVKFDGPGTVGDHAEMVMLNSTTAAAVWFASVNGAPSLKIGKLNLETGAVTNIKDLGESDDHIHDVVRLSNGNLAVITAQVDAQGMRYANKIKIVSSNFATVKNWFSVHGNGFPLDAWAYIDQTVVEKDTGGIALYRDHVTNKIVGRNFTNAGQLGTNINVSSTAMQAFAVSDIAYLEVKAARLSNGKIAVCWVHNGTTGADRYDVRCRVLTASGTAAGDDFLVHADKTGGQVAPEVIALPGGLFSVTWVQIDNTFPAAIKYRTFDSSGKPKFGERVASTLTDLAFTPFNTEAVLLADGSIAQVMGPSAFVPGLRGAGIASPHK